MKEQRIWPSVMVSNQNNLDSLLDKLKGSSKTLHLDISDGKFVPTTNMWFDFRLMEGYNYNAHLMVNDPKKWITKYGGKVDVCIPQLEVIKDVKHYISWMKNQGYKVAFALKPETGIKRLRPYLAEIDTILILTVHPGYYGARHLRTPLRKIAQVKKGNPNIEVIVDGGINPQTIANAAKAGADYFVSGSYVTKADDPKKAVQELEKRL